MKVKSLELQLEKKELPKLQKKNAEMEEKISELENEQKVIHWLTTVMKEAVDTRDVLKKYATLKEDHKILKKETS